MTLKVGSSVDVENVSVEEVADLWRAAIRSRVSKVVSSLSIAVGGAERSIKGTAAENGRTHVGVIALIVIRSVNGSVTEVAWGGVPRRDDESVVSVTVRASNDDLELVTPLAVHSSVRQISEVDQACQNSPVVVGIGSADGTTPEDTLDHGNTGRVLAAGSSGARVDARVTLKVEIE